MSDDNLKDLLKKSRAKNETLNITGMLLYLDPFFIQVLEGEGRWCINKVIINQWGIIVFLIKNRCFLPN
jgi:hypothetical protein